MCYNQLYILLVGDSFSINQALTMFWIVDTDVPTHGEP